ncbi:ExeM/NucH family extracellular endonuclease [Archangium sp.]|uniref:ExeM/NucH family extracellular endonuclease n=1 Tax=Archangium sp. TaxID=1872627 RepID=UPI002D2478FB|nr:ExeM/NucH family extracellular endonuclease [Archangium sp.]HYO58203.1 ExeM/NucH family extracellular endonuclease [Archangium sp.]
MKRLIAITMAVALAPVFPAWAEPEFSAERVAEAVGSCPGGVTLTPTSAIQGSGASSPLTGRPVTTEGVVVGDYQPAELQSGFFIQDAQGDGNPATSEGLFVYVPKGNALSSIDVRPGDRVRVSGTVKEFRTGNGTLTELDLVTALSVCTSGAGLPPTSVALPVRAVTDLEAYEGMLVTFVQELTVTETYGLGRYGELLLSSGGRLFNPTNGQGGTLEEYARRRIVLDDGSSRQNPAPIPFLSSSSSDGTRRVGDTVRGLTGVLTYGTSEYRIYPTLAPAFVNANPRTAAPEALAGDLKVASFNVLNYFTTLNSRGANSATEFARQKAKIVAALKAIDADIVGLIEVENNGTTALQNLVDALNAAYGAPVYAAVPDPLTGTGSDAIKVAFIYKPLSVSLAGPSISFPDPIFDRYPVAQTFHQGGGDGQVGSDFTVVINHFKSKGSCPSSGDVDRGQGCWNLKRIEQASKLLEFIGELQGRSSDADVLVIGDLNAYGEEDPVRTLVAGGLEHLSLRIPAARRYSYVFEGQSGELDHALATPSLAEQVRGITAWNINSDEPPVLDYNTEFKTDDRYAPTPFRSSDHDPLIISFDLDAVCAVDPGAPTLELNGGHELTLECGVDTWLEPGAWAADACGPLEVHTYNSGHDAYGPGPNTRAQGTYPVQYIAWTSAGYTVDAVRSVHVADRTPPTLKLKGDVRMTHTCGSRWVDPGVEAWDACYGDVAPTVVPTGYVNGWVPGVYTVRYDVRDSGGNAAPPVTRTVEVVNCPW